VDAIQRNGGTAIGVTADLTDESDITKLAHKIRGTFGVLQLLAAFAGGDGLPEPTLEMSIERWTRIMESNLLSTILTLRAFLPEMIEQRRGAVVTMSSSAARQPGSSSAAYAVAKAGVIALTRHLALELGPAGVRLNCVAPSAILTPGTAALAQVQQKATDCLPLKRLGKPDDVTGAALFLLSDASSWITGVTLDVAGGLIML
jgi:3-oxoacyl-[acyl-carrier protein] reductase